MNLIPYEKLAEWIRVFRIFAFDARVSWLNLLSLLCGLILYTVLFFDNYTLYSEVDMPLHPLVVKSVQEVQSSQDLKLLLVTISTALSQTMYTKATIQSVFIDIQASLSDFNGVSLARQTCSKATCLLYPKSENKISKYSYFIGALQRTVTQSELEHIKIGIENFNSATISELYSSNWLTESISDGTVTLTFLTRNSLSDRNSYTTYIMATEFGNAGKVVRSNMKAFVFRLNTGQTLMSIFTTVFFSMSLLLYITKYFAKLNFMFSQFYLFYGMFFMVTLVFSLTCLGLLRSAMKDMQDLPAEAIGVDQIARLFNAACTYKLSFLFLGVMFSVEIIKLLLFANRFEKVKSATIVLLRTFGILFKLLLFILIILLLANWSVLLFDGWLGDQEYVDLIFRYGSTSPASAGYLAAAAQSFRLMLIGLAHLVIFVVVFVAIHNAENFEYD